MDKKIQKKIDALRTRLQNLRNKLAGAKKQQDDPDEVKQIEKQIADANAEIETLKAS